MKRFLFIICILSLQINIWADSPLTSTEFWQAYQDVEIIKKAQMTNGKLNDELCAYLVDKNNPIDVKMALINCMGWSISGKSNSIYFLQYLASHKKIKNEKQLKAKGSDHILLCYAYLKAMDNYFNVRDAFEWADLACKKNSKSFTFAMIRGLIEAQIQLDINWCNVYKVVKAVLDNKSLQRDMRQKAIDIIWEYIVLYQETC